jgi:prepilin-type N-terminal cleavage/methylation domain-containing protein
MKRLKDNWGFTLIEIIVVLIILGIVAVVLSNAIVYGVQSYIFARDADQLSQRAQLAMARINKELTDITAVSFVSADQIDYTLTKNTVPSCTVALPAGCQYSMRRDNINNQITLEGTNPVVAPQVLINGLTANNGGNNFLSYFRSDGTTAWTIADGFSNNNNTNANYLATIRVWISLDFPSGGNHLDYQGTINPRVNGVLNAPQLN